MSRTMDWSVLRELFGEHAALRQRMLAMFVSETERDLSALTTACEARDYEKARAHAHRMAGAARMIGALALASAAKLLEDPDVYEDDASLSGPLEGARAAVAAVFEEIRSRAE